MLESVADEYDGVLEPDVHYLPVRADFADADAVVERLRRLHAARAARRARPPRRRA